MNTNEELGLSSLIPAILRAVEHSVSTDLAPEVTSPNGKALIDMIGRLVRWSVAELEQHHALYAARMESWAPLLPPGTAQPDRPASAAGLICGPTMAEREYFKQSAMLAVTLEAQLRSSARSQDNASLASRLHGLIAGEARFHEALDPESAAEIASAYHGGKGNSQKDQIAVLPTVTNESLTSYLGHRFPEHASTAKGVQLLTGGMGKDTILFELTGHPQFSGALVMRKDLKVLTLDISAVDEFALLQAVHAAGVNVPEPLWAENDPHQLGSRFIVVRRARGSVAISQDISNERTRRHFADKLAEGLAAIHGLNLPGSKLFQDAAGGTLTDVLKQQIATWRAYWMEKRLEPSIKLDIAFAWLESNMPPDPGFAATLVHGDYGFHNLMMEDGEVTAILDWEFAHMGDPAEDVNYCRQFIERYVPFEYFLDRYLARGGKPYDAARDRFFTVWRNVRNAVASVGALSAFRRQTPGNIKLATAGLAYDPRFELEALRLIVGYLENSLS
jgi:aminoglycoside phosphotransferase (APT) family kinase protein